MKDALKLAGPSTTTATTGSAPTSSCAGWQLGCSSGSPRTGTGDTWRNIRHELDRMHLVTLATADGRVGAALRRPPKARNSRPASPRPARTTPNS